MNFTRMPKMLKNIVKDDLNVFGDGLYYYSDNINKFVNLEKEISSLYALKRLLNGV